MWPLERFSGICFLLSVHTTIFVGGQRSSVDLKKLYSVYVGHLPNDITEVKYFFAFLAAFVVLIGVSTR
jgi:hypothetical protein